MPEHFSSHAYLWADADTHKNELSLECIDSSSLLPVVSFFWAILDDLKLFLNLQSFFPSNISLPPTHRGTTFAEAEPQVE